MQAERAEREKPEDKGRRDPEKEREEEGKRLKRTLGQEKKERQTRRYPGGFSWRR